MESESRLVASAPIVRYNDGGDDNNVRDVVRYYHFNLCFYPCIILRCSVYGNQKKYIN